MATSIEKMRRYRAENPVLSFVPTMGALHDGHLTLVKQAKEKNCKVVVSIFVNPTQFSVGEDLDKYPRQLEADLAKLKPLGVDCVFTPTQQEMYPGDSLCHVEPAKFSQISEGLARPEFFRGVATVVTKLFNIVQPSYAFFGQKDISQCILIQRMVRDLDMPVHVKICPTIRETDGLAMSSRNAYLSPAERPVCGILYKALMDAKRVCERTECRKTPLKREEIIATTEAVLRSEPQVTRIEYVSVASHIDMTELAAYDAHAPGAGAVISAAIRIGNVRLIDNVLVGQAVKDILG
jgi:pantoate--beta-alanine ligase